VIGGMRAKRFTLTAACLAATVTGCSFQGLNSLPLPGAVGRGPESVTYHVELPNVSTLESNSPVLVNDVVVGSVGKMKVDNWHADVEISVKRDVVLPANAVATVGQTSLLGSMHLALNPPLGEPPSGQLQPGATIGLNRSSAYPTTEKTLSALSAVVNGGGLGQIGDIIHNINTALGGREPEIRELLTRLNNVIGVLDQQRDNIITSIQQLRRLAGTFAGQSDVLDRALKDVPPALEVLVKERPLLTTALEKLGTFADTTTRLVNDAGDDLVTNLRNLEPTIKALADVGPDLTRGLVFGTAFPYGPAFADRVAQGDYINLFAVFDLTYPRLKRTFFLGTRWGDEDAKLIPAPGDPFYLNYSYDPLGAGIAPPPPPPDEATNVAALPAPQPLPDEPMPPVTEPLVPVAPPANMISAGVTAALAKSQIFAGPYGDQPVPAAPAPPPDEMPLPPGGGG
jgi:phospholipid/cholesterol/gamma-HCH transport system substrate-binding protein